MLEHVEGETMHLTTHRRCLATLKASQGIAVDALRALWGRPADLPWTWPAKQQLPEATSRAPSKPQRSQLTSEAARKSK